MNKRKILVLYGDLKGFVNLMDIDKNLTDL